MKTWTLVFTFFASVLAGAAEQSQPTLLIVTEPGWCSHCKDLEKKLKEYASDFKEVQIGTISGRGYKTNEKLSDWKKRTPQGGPTLSLSLKDLAEKPEVQYLPTTMMVTGGKIVPGSLVEGADFPKILMSAYRSPIRPFLKCAQAIDRASRKPLEKEVSAKISTGVCIAQSEGMYFKKNAAPKIEKITEGHTNCNLALRAAVLKRLNGLGAGQTPPQWVPDDFERVQIYCTLAMKDREKDQTMEEAISKLNPASGAMSLSVPAEGASENAE